MYQLLILYFIICLIIGAVSLVISVLIYSSSKDRFIRYFLYFYTPFTLLVCVATLDRYLIANALLTSRESTIAIKLILFFFLSLLYAAIPIYSNGILRVKRGREINTVFIILAIVAFIAYPIGIIPDTGNKNGYNSFLFIGETIFIIINIYSLVTGILFYRNNEDSLLKRNFKATLISIFIFIPLLTNDFINYLKLPYGAFFFPLLYCWFSMVQISYIMVKYFNLKRELTEAAPPDSGFFNTYELTNREQEIFYLIVKGYSNSKIADELFISTMTVKTHVYNIFKKTGVKTRFELTGLLNERNKNTDGKR